MNKNIAQVIDAARKTMPQQGNGGAQVTPAVAQMQRSAAQARGVLRNVRKGGDGGGGGSKRPGKC